LYGYNTPTVHERRNYMAQSSVENISEKPILQEHLEIYRQIPESEAKVIKTKLQSLFTWIKRLGMQESLPPEELQITKVKYDTNPPTYVVYAAPNKVESLKFEGDLSHLVVSEPKINSNFPDSDGYYQHNTISLYFQTNENRSGFSFGKVLFAANDAVFTFTSEWFDYFHVDCPKPDYHILLVGLFGVHKNGYECAEAINVSEKNMNSRQNLAYLSMSGMVWYQKK
jgi:hypothetical protein